MSPCLYNIFMNTFAEEVSSVPDSVSEQPAQRFADDVKLHAKTGKGLQKILDIGTSWATRNSVKWNTRPGKSEFLKYKRPAETQVLAGRPETTPNMETLVSGSQHGLRSNRPG